MKVVGKNIKAFRIKRKMTQNELADALFVTRQTVSNYETGKSQPDIEAIVKIAEVLKTDANTLIYGKPLEECKKRAIKWAIFSTVIYLSVVILGVTLYLICKELSGDSIANPIIVLKLLVYPFSALFSGWFAMHLIGIFTKLEPLNNKTAKTIRIVLAVLVIVILAGVLYYTAFHTYSFIKEYLYDSVNISWYSNIIINRIVGFWITQPWAFVPLGAISWFLGLPYIKK